MGRTSWVVATILFFPATGVLAQSPETQMQGSQERIVFFSGSVVLEDGSAPPGQVLIQRVCNGSSRNEAYTDSKGDFSFKVESVQGTSTTVDATESPSQAYDLNKAIGNSTQYSMPISTALRDCELQAVLPGFRSERVSLAQKSTMENVHLGAIILHPLSHANALIVSATTLAAPSHAKRDYEKGLAAIHDQKWEAAQTAFSKAVREYPAFAVAWYQLGLVRQQQNDLAGAIEAWQEAVKSDPKYLKPYENLALLADQRGDWPESEKNSRAWLQLDAEDFPAAYLFNAVANAQLNHLEEAERAAREGLRIDHDHRLPRLNYVLGLVLLNEHKWAESANCFRAYLQLVPNAKEAELVRQQLAILDRGLADSVR